MNLLIQIILSVHAVSYFQQWREEKKPFLLVLSILLAGVFVYSCVSTYGGAA